jgi:hypothetical protein
VHAGNRSVQVGVVQCGRFQRTQRTALQLGQHKVQPCRHLVARHHAAAEHLFAPLVQGVVGVVEGFHAPQCRMGHAPGWHPWAKGCGVPNGQAAQGIATMWHTAKARPGRALLPFTAV